MSDKQFAHGIYLIHNGNEVITIKKYDCRYNQESSGEQKEKKKKKEKGCIHINVYIYNHAETGGQISGNGSQNANQGGQIAKNGGQNANQDGVVIKECRQKKKNTKTKKLNFEDKMKEK